MKNKVRPNQMTYLIRCINHSQKLNKLAKTKEERGITLIVLLVTIIVLVIISAVAINIALGDNGIITSTETATRNYTIAEYEEIIEENVQRTILESAVMGEEATLENLRDNLNSTEIGFQTITKGDSISDVIVKTKEGYLFEAYFDEELGEYHVEYMGEADSSYIPEVNISYDEASRIMTVNATTGNINKISIILNGEEVNSVNGNSLTYTVEDSGTYRIEIETKEGLTRYGYVNIGLKKDILTAPKIEVVAGTEGSNGWYRSEVNVNIDPSGTNGQRMKYKLVGATEQEETEVADMASPTAITISNAGLTKIIAWVEYEEEGKVYRSDYSYYNIKIDSVSPNAPTVNITATEGNEVSNESTYWYKTTVEVEITGEDANSGIYGYTYSITGTSNISETSLVGNKQKLIFETDGTFTLIIKAIDRAGNISNAYTLTVYKDSTEPNEFVPNISNVTNNSFTISAYTQDDTSGMQKYEYYVNNEKKYEGTENTYTVEGLNKDQTYGVYVVAYDNAGNIRASSSISAYTSESTQGSTGGSSGGIQDGSTIGYGTYTITYDANGVEVDKMPNSRYFVHGETIQLTEEFPHSNQAGYNFLAWSTDPQAQETLYYPGEEITGYGNITLYAIWTDKCTITFNANGGDNTPASLSFYDGYSIVLPSNAGTYANDAEAELLGWAYTADNNFIFYKPGEAYNDYAHGSCTLYAVWDLGNLIYIDTNGGSYNKTYDDIVPQMFTFATGLGVNLPTDAGEYTANSNINHFKWVLGSKEGTEYYEGGDYFSNTNADGQTLYAMWDNYIIFNANGGTITPEPQIQRYAETITLPTSAGMNGYKVSIQGWGISNNTTIEEGYVKGSNYSSKTSGENITLYAIWCTLMAGEYIDYSSDEGNFTSESTYSGSSTKDFATVTTLKWRILKNDDKTLTLISDTTANDGFTLNGANGYNNGVLLLNNACEAMYSNSSLGVTGRSIKMEDIETLSKYNKKNSWYDGIRYEEEVESSSSRDYYPKIFALEKTGAPGGKYGTKYGLSDQEEYITGYTRTSSRLYGKLTYYTYTLSTSYLNENQLEVLRYKPETTTNLSNYWIATRCASYDDSDEELEFRIFCLLSGKVDAFWFFDSYYNSNGSRSYAIRPVVEIDLSKVRIGVTGDGTSNSPYSITDR